MNTANFSTVAGPDLSPQPFQRVVEVLSAGGPIMVILACLSVLALAIVFVKLWQFRGVRATGGIEEALRTWRDGRHSEAINTLSASPHPAAAVVAVAMRGTIDQRLPEKQLREEVIRVANRHLESLRMHLKGLEVIGALSPLLGLLGTVLGMIEAFQQLEAAGTRANPALLSGGIWEALLTTAAGLGVAIPTVVALHWFDRRIERLRHVMEDAVTRVFTTILSVDRSQAPVGEIVKFKADHAH